MSYGQEVLVVAFDDELGGAWAPYFAERSSIRNVFYLFEPAKALSAPPFEERWNPAASDEAWAHWYAEWLLAWGRLTGGALPYPISGPAYPRDFDLTRGASFEAQVLGWYLDWKKKVGDEIAKAPPPKTVRCEA